MKLKDYLQLKYPDLFYSLLKIKDSSLLFLSTKQRFARKAQKNSWKDTESRSGPGSNWANTAGVRAGLPVLCTNLAIRSMLDIPCGDFYWMKELDLGLDRYIGADIVDELIQANQVYASGQKAFLVLDLLKDDLPQVDLVFCRDCWIHFSFKDIFHSIANIKRSGSVYLCTTTYTRLDKNRDILTGEWHPINLQIPPFSFPTPIQVIDEKPVQGIDTLYPGKALGLWKTVDLP
jgi:hypothetical protein